jgi:NADPH:quinone reductase-like Zn-dependent oxidoreductase
MTAQHRQQRRDFLISIQTSLVFDTVGGSLAQRAATSLGSSSRFVSIVDPAATALVGSRGTFFVVEPDRDGLTEIARMVDEGLLNPIVGRQSKLSDGPTLLEAKELGRTRKGFNQHPLTTVRSDAGSVGRRVTAESAQCRS